ncbi:MAG: ABC transporter ATP-binding protein [Chlamydiae bacterium]|nr:ABC transporter ATP-binding protein [Chlamydiota bacterium]
MMSILIQIKNLKKHFQKNGLLIKAVDDIDLNIFKGEILALVGESGSGKSTLGKMIARLIESTFGEILYDQKDVFSYKKNDLFLRKEIQIIFQDPFSSLNPKMRISEILQEPLKIHKLFKNEEQKKVEDLLKMVSLPNVFNHYPHELSGGQKQRVAIAKALSLNPKFLICDEPISSLDISTQAQIMALLKELQTRLKLTYLFISHDLKMVKYIADRIAIMYLGQIVEIAPKHILSKKQLHPYTKILFASIFKINEKMQELALEEKPCEKPGCVFYSKCPIAKELCIKKEPKLREIKEGHLVKCHFATSSGS